MKTFKTILYFTLVGMMINPCFIIDAYPYSDRSDDINMSQTVKMGAGWVIKSVYNDNNYQNGKISSDLNSDIEAFQKPKDADKPNDSAENPTKDLELKRKASSDMSGKQVETEVKNVDVTTSEYQRLVEVDAFAGIPEVVNGSITGITSVSGQAYYSYDENGDLSGVRIHHEQREGAYGPDRSTDWYFESNGTWIRTVITREALYNEPNSYNWRSVQEISYDSGETNSPTGIMTSTLNVYFKFGNEMKHSIVDTTKSLYYKSSNETLDISYVRNVCGPLPVEGMAKNESWEATAEYLEKFSKKTSLGGARHISLNIDRFWSSGRKQTYNTTITAGSRSIPAISTGTVPKKSKRETVVTSREVIREMVTERIAYKPYRYNRETRAALANAPARTKDTGRSSETVSGLGIKRELDAGQGQAPLDIRFSGETLKQNDNNGQRYLDYTGDIGGDGQERLISASEVEAPLESFISKLSKKENRTEIENRALELAKIYQGSGIEKETSNEVARICKFVISINGMKNLPTNVDFNVVNVSLDNLLARAAGAKSQFELGVQSCYNEIFDTVMKNKQVWWTLTDIMPEEYFKNDKGELIRFAVRVIKELPESQKQSADELVNDVISFEKKLSSIASVYYRTLKEAADQCMAKINSALKNIGNGAISENATDVQALIVLPEQK